MGPTLVSRSVTFGLLHTSQLADLLLTVNDSHRLPPDLHYDLLSPPPSESSVPPLEPDQPPTKPSWSSAEARAVLAEAQSELRCGAITHADYGALLSSLRSALGPPKTLSVLTKITHSILDEIQLVNLPSELHEDPLTGYLSPPHEDEYLTTLDASIDGLPTQSDSHPIRGLERASEAALKNPVSVYNWLRKHHPQVFLQDENTVSGPKEQATDGKEGKEGKASANTAQPVGQSTTASAKKEGRSKRGSMVPEILDDEGFVISGGTEPAEKAVNTGRGKRKREDEPYRPKRGSGVRSKRKRTSGAKAVEPE